MPGIDEQRPVAREQHVRRLDVTVNDRLPMERGQGLGDRCERGGGAPHAQAPVVDALGDRRPVVEDEREVRLAVVLTGVEEPDQCGVAHLPEHRRLPCEPGGGEGILNACAAQLDRDDDPVAVRAPDLRVAPAAEVSLQAERPDPSACRAPRGRTSPSPHSHHQPPSP